MDEISTFLIKTVVFSGVQADVIAILTSILACVTAYVTKRLGDDVLSSERWVRHFASAFFVISVQYAALTLDGLKDEGFLWLPDFAFPLFATVYALGSPLSNLFFLTAALTLLGRERLSFAGSTREMLEVPTSVLAIACAAFLFQALFLMQPYHRLLDGIFSAAVFFILGVALFRAASPGRFDIGLLSFIGAALHGVFNLLFAVTPIVIGSRYLEPLRAPIAKIRGDGSMVTVEQALEHFFIGSTLFYKLLIILGAWYMIQKSLLVLAPVSGSILREISEKRLDLLSSRGFPRLLADRIGADLVSLWILLPGMGNRALRLRFEKGKEVQPSSDWPRLSDLHETMSGYALSSSKEVVFSTFYRDNQFDRGEQISEADWTPEAVVACPVRYNGQVIGLVHAAWKKSRTDMRIALFQINEVTGLISPSVFSKRQMIALELVHRSLEPDEDGSLDKTCLRLLERLQDILGAYGAGLYLDEGFRRLCLYRNRTMVELEEVDDLPTFQDQVCHVEGGSVTFENIIITGGASSARAATFFLARTGEETTKALFLENDVYRSMIANSIEQVLHNAVMRDFAGALSELGKWLTQAETPEQWVAFLSDTWKAIADASLGVAFGEDVFLGDQEFKKVDLLPTESNNLELYSGPFGSNVPPHILQIRLQHVDAKLLLGIQRKEFGPELQVGTSPWRYCVERFAEIADTALARINNYEMERWLIEADRPTFLNHELKNQVMGLQLLTKNLERDIKRMAKDLARSRLSPSDFEEATLRLNRMKSQLDRMVEMTREMGPPTLKKQTNASKLLDIIQEAERRYHHFLRLRDITLENKVDFTEEVKMSPEELVHSLTTLFANATDAMGNGGKIMLENEAGKGEMLFHITNTGPAIPQEHVAQIFKPGFTTKTKGTGLGLTLVMRSLKRVGGKLKLTNNEKGCVRFTMTLPVVKVGTHA